MLVTEMTIPVAVWVVGRAVRARRDHEARAAQQGLTDERLRIARDLHDGVAHSLSLITVQASVALHVGAERPDEARSALTVIEATSREAARELRRMLGLLRAVDEDPQGAAQLEPAPTGWPSSRTMRPPPGPWSICGSATGSTPSRLPSGSRSTASCRSP